MKNKSARIVINISLIFAIILGTFFINIPYIYGEDTPVNSEETREISIGESSGEPKEANKENAPPKKDETPYIKEYAVAGEYNRGKRGIEYFANITISLIGENLTDDHFLTEEGLHWSERTETQLITGVELGNYDFSAFPNEAPNREVKAYRIENGDSGRLTYVGKTKSGIDLDIVWTIIDSDKSDWEENSGYLNTGTGVKGVAFTGEQFFRGGSGNSIAVLYNRASNLGINYKIVKHGTFEEMPVILSFISSDIDSAQGVETDLANIVEIIPPDSNLVKKDGVIYDSQGGVVNLNGSTDLPKGGYLGAGFLSSFNYIFYSPAPLRVNDSYYYPIATRYDIFGSSLQAKMLTRINQHISLEYLDKQGNEIKEKEYYQGYTDESYIFKSILISGYRLISIQKDENNIHFPVIKFIYTREYNVKLKFRDEGGNNLLNDREYEYLEGENIEYEPPVLEGYETPKTYNGIVDKDIEHIFVYKKKAKAELPASNDVNISKDTGRSSVKYEQAKSSNVGGYKTNLGKNTKPKAVKKAKEDPFLINTKMNSDEKKLFLQYIGEVKKNAKKKYGNDKDKINHAIANAIAYSVYATDFLQSHANDFGDENKFLYTDDFDDLTDSTHRDKPYLIDFPHFATTIATTYRSGLDKELFKAVAGTPILNIYRLIANPNPLKISFLAVKMLTNRENFRKDNLFQVNSLTGDWITHMDKKDRRSDIDAIIFHYHPDFKNLTLDEFIKRYYHMKNLDKERERLYKEVLKIQSKGYISPKEQERLNKFAGVMSCGGIALILYTIKKRKSAKKILDKCTKLLSSSGKILFKRNKKAVIKPIKRFAKTVMKKIIKPKPHQNVLHQSGSYGNYSRSSVHSRYTGYRGSKAGTKPVKTYRSKVIKNVRHNAKKYIKKHIVKPIKKFWRKLWR